MLVFTKAKLVFLSVPKTGTTAYEAALAPHADIAFLNPPELKHAPVFRYNRFIRPALEKFVAEDLTVLAVMREPVSWLGSWYRYRQRPSMTGHANATHGLSFDDFVLAYLKGNRPPFAEVGSQAKFLEPQKNGTAVTHLFRYEDQKGLQAFLQARLGLSFNLERLNSSPELPMVLSQDVERRLRRKCSLEFQLWESIAASGSYSPLPRSP